MLYSIHRVAKIKSSFSFCTGGLEHKKTGKSKKLENQKIPVDSFMF